MCEEDIPFQGNDVHVQGKHEDRALHDLQLAIHSALLQNLFTDSCLQETAISRLVSLARQGTHHAGHAQQVVVMAETGCRFIRSDEFDDGPDAGNGVACQEAAAEEQTSVATAGTGMTLLFGPAGCAAAGFQFVDLVHAGVSEECDSAYQVQWGDEIAFDDQVFSAGDLRTSGHVSCVTWLRNGLTSCRQEMIVRWARDWTACGTESAGKCMDTELLGLRILLFVISFS